MIFLTLRANYRYSILQKFHNGSSGWSKITLVDGARVPREALFENLSKFSSIPFSPICLTTQGKFDLSFYVEKTVEANAIKNCDKMTVHIDSHLSMNEDTPKEHKLNIRVISSRPPETTINSKGNISQKLGKSGANPPLFDTQK